jgi:hypothetical protein
MGTITVSPHGGSRTKRVMSLEYLPGSESKRSGCGMARPPHHMAEGEVVAEDLSAKPQPGTAMVTYDPSHLAPDLAWSQRCCASTQGKAKICQMPSTPSTGNRSRRAGGRCRREAMTSNPTLLDRSATRGREGREPESHRYSSGWWDAAGSAHPRRWRGTRRGPGGLLQLPCHELLQALVRCRRRPLPRREREGWWRVGRDTGAARWRHCRPRGAVKKFPFVFLNRHRKIHGSCYSKKKSAHLALQKECIMLTNQAMTRSNHKASHYRELRAPLGLGLLRYQINQIYSLYADIKQYSDHTLVQLQIHAPHLDHPNRIWHSTLISSPRSKYLNI